VLSEIASLLADLHVSGASQLDLQSDLAGELGIDSLAIVELHDRRARVLGGAAALVHPVAFAEPFGLSVVEALACGTPVVAYPNGAMPELVQAGVNGFLAAGFDEAVAALDKIDTIDRTDCRADAEDRFSARRMAVEYLAVYERVLGGA
jgi:glycosyltransferase involved in cell wall biosynthesis